MNIEVITMWYNEAFLAPLFLRHYGFVDRIRVIIDTDSNDDTLSILSECSNAFIEQFTFPDMMDDQLKVNRLNTAYDSSKADWVILVDADEFVFADPNQNGCGIREFLEQEENDVIWVKFFQVYRNKRDKELNPLKNPIVQRRHGDSNTETGINALYNKPVAVRGGMGIEWVFGNHFIKNMNGLKISDRFLYGSHWAMADPCFCVERRIKGRRDRQSKHNIETGMTYQHHNITEEQVLAECESHLDDKRLF